MTLLGRRADSSQGEERSSSALIPAKKGSGGLAFSLVVTMLGILLLLICGVIWVTARPPSGSSVDPEHLLEFGKWSLSVLLGAFGAWIGAGAAYFFGRENLAESSRSTEAALKIQQQVLRRPQEKERIRELTLTSMNPEFMFKENQTKKDVFTALGKHNDYWWVPVLNQDGKRTLEDVIHARVFWNTAISDDHTLSAIVSDITSGRIKDSLKLRGANSFFVKVTLDDKISDVAEKMDVSGAVVGIVVDEKGRPTACFTRQDILNVGMASTSP